MKNITLLGLRFYQQYVSLDKGWLGKLIPHSGQVCRYEPSCSEYAVEAVETFGTIQGLWLAAKRVGRCHPWGGHGFDPVPTK